MSDIGEKLQQQAEKSIISMITSGNWIQPDYSNRVKLPKDFMESVWQSVDQEKVKAELARRLEEELANRIVNHMAAELATDIKQILSVQERREAIRAIARKHMHEIMAAGESQ
jgi:Mg/Co/Ni transporter MgtE